MTNHFRGYLKININEKNVVGVGGFVSNAAQVDIGQQFHESRLN